MRGTPPFSLSSVDRDRSPSGPSTGSSSRRRAHHRILEKVSIETVRLGGMPSRGAAAGRHAGNADPHAHPMLRIVRACHPAVGMTCRGDEPDNEVLFRSPADWVSPGSYRIYANAPPVAEGRKVSLLDTDHVFGVGGDRRWIWKAFTRGHNPIYMDPVWRYIPDKGNGKGRGPGLGRPRPRRRTRVWTAGAARSRLARRGPAITVRFAGPDLRGSTCPTPTGITRFSSARGRSPCTSVRRTESVSTTTFSPTA